MKRVENESSGGKENSLLNIRMLQQILSARSRCEQFFFIIAFVVFLKKFSWKGDAPIQLCVNAWRIILRFPLVHITQNQKRGTESTRDDSCDNEKSTSLIALYTHYSRYFFAPNFLPSYYFLSLFLSFTVVDNYCKWISRFLFLSLSLLVELTYYYENDSEQLPSFARDNRDHFSLSEDFASWSRCVGVLLVSSSLCFSSSINRARGTDQGSCRASRTRKSRRVIITISTDYRGEECVQPR